MLEITRSCFLADEAATEGAGAALALSLIQVGVTTPLIVFLQGNLGSGKTTLSRGVLRELGHIGPVKSPTYTLVEPYALDCGDVYHFDLYRLRDPAELHYLGVQDYFDHGLLCLVEWPEKGFGLLPPSDMTVELSMETKGEIHGRRLVLAAQSELGVSILKAFTLTAFFLAQK